MLITQHCAHDCPNHNTTVYEGTMIALNTLNGQILIGTQKIGERCEKCGGILVFIVEGDIERRKEGTEAYQK